MLKIMLELAMVILASILPFQPGLQDLYLFDDRPAVMDNKAIWADTPADLFHKDFWGENILSNRSHKSYRPLTSLTFWLQAQHNHTGVALRMKLVNLAVNSINSLLSLNLLKTWMSGSLISSSWVPLSTSIIFSVHPVHVEPVVSIVGRADLLYSCSFLLGLVIYRHLKQLTHSYLTSFLKYATAFLFALVAMLCKEQGVLVLVMLLAMEVPNLMVKNRRNLMFVFYLLLSITVLAYYRMKLIDFQAPVFRREDNPVSFSRGMTRVLSSLYLACLHTFLILCPSSLCFDWSMGCVPLLKDFTDTRIVSVAIFLLLFSGLVWRAVSALIWNTTKLVYLSLCLTLVPFLLCLHVVLDLGFVVAERSLYLSVLGVSLAYHIGVVTLRKCCRSKLQRLLVTCGHGWVVLSLCFKTINRSSDWQNEKRLYHAGLTVCPNNAKVFYNLAKLSTETAESKLLYHQTILLAPRFEHALNNLANIYRAEGEVERAEALLTRAVNINPHFAAAHMNLGIVLMKLEKFKEAREHLEQALNLKSPYPDCIYNLGNLHLKMGNLVEAEHFFRLGWSLEHSLSLSNLITLLDNQNRITESRELAAMAVKYFPDKSGFRFQLANALGQMDMYVESEREYLEALRLDEKVTYLLNLGILYHRWGRYSEAGNCYQSVLDRQPNHSRANQLLKQIQPKIKN